MKSLMIAGVATLALATLPAAGNAQMQGGTSQPGTTMTAEQQRAYDALSAEDRAVYDRMPAEQQRYFMTLNAQQRQAWFLLDDDQRMRIYNMDATQRAAAWTSIMEQVNAANAGAAGTMQQGTAGTTMGNTMTNPGSTSTGTTAAGSTMTNTMANPASTTTGAARTTGSTMTGSTASGTSMNNATTGGATSGNIRFQSSTVVQPIADNRPSTSGEVPVCDRNRTDSCINPWEAGRRGANVNRPLDTFPEARATAPRQ